jgi:ribosomal RNA-processing protein 36
MAPKKVDEELERIRRRAEMMPSDDEMGSEDLDDEGSDDGDASGYGGGERGDSSYVLAGYDGGSSDDNSSEEEAEAPPPRVKPAQQQLRPSGGKTSAAHDDDEDDEGDEGLDNESNDDDDDDEDEDEDEEDGEDDGGDRSMEARARRAARMPLKEVPLAERMALKMYGGDGALGSGAKHTSRQGGGGGGGGGGSGTWDWGALAAAGASMGVKGKAAEKAKKAHKHAPMEMSSKKAVGRHREVVEVAGGTAAKYKARDPRFEDLSTTALAGKAHADQSAFLEAKRKAEIRELSGALAKEKKKRGGRLAASSDAKVEVLKAATLRLKQQDGEAGRRKVEAGALKEWREGEKAKVAGGKQPFFLKRAAQKELVAASQFTALRKGKGGKKRVEKLVEKKRKKVVAKERKWVPVERAAHGQGGGEGGAWKRRRTDAE